MNRLLRMGMVMIVFGIIVIGVLIIRKPREQRNEVVLGAILPLTGDVASYGVAVHHGIELATSEINKSGGVGGRRLRVVYEDDRADPQTGVTAARKLIAVDAVPAIIGAVPSSVTLALAPIVTSEQVVLLSPASSSPEITNAGEWVFRNYPSDDLEGRVIADFAAQNGRCRTVGMLTINNEYGNGLQRVYREHFTSLNGSIVYDEKFAEGTRDFRALLSPVRVLRPACMFVVGYSRELGTLIRQARQLGVQAQFLSTVNFFDPQSLTTGGPAVEGVIFTSPVFDPSSPDSTVQKFVSSFVAKFGQQPDVWSAHGYDAVMLLVTAIRQRGSAPNDIRVGLGEIRNYAGVAGMTSFDSQGDVAKPARLLTVRNGAFVPFTAGPP
jgi:branched-chain amino acid transport system substrate-binding protein